MSSLPDSNSDEGVLSEERRQRGQQLQAVRESPRKGVAGKRRIRRREGSGGTLFENREWKTETGGVCAQSEAARIHEGISKEPRGKESSRRRNNSAAGKATTNEILSNATRQSRNSTETCEASISGRYQRNADGPRMGGDIEESERSLRILRNDKAPDNGPHHSIESGRSPHERKCDSSMQELQLLEKRSPASRNIRSVWHIATTPYKNAHFATFPPDLIEPAILAGTSAKGVCSACGAPWRRQILATAPDGRTAIMGARSPKMDDGPLIGRNAFDSDVRGSFTASHGVLSKQTIGWEPTCACAPCRAVPATVLDPFFGSGTTGLVCDRLQRDCIGIDLNPEYAAMATARITDDAPLFAQVEVAE